MFVSKTFEILQITSSSDSNKSSIKCIEQQDVAARTKLYPSHTRRGSAHKKSAVVVGANAIEEGAKESTHRQTEIVDAGSDRNAETQHLIVEEAAKELDIEVKGKS